MKLDRNVNPDGKGKYCLINLRKTLTTAQSMVVIDALKALDAEGVLHWGNESPGDQFFVMKYKDFFTSAGLLAYALAVKDYADLGMSQNRMSPKEFDHWMEWYKEILAEADKARACEHQLPT